MTHNALYTEVRRASPMQRAMEGKMQLGALGPTFVHKCGQQVHAGRTSTDRRREQVCTSKVSLPVATELPANAKVGSFYFVFSAFDSRRAVCKRVSYNANLCMNKIVLERQKTLFTVFQSVLAEPALTYTVGIRIHC